MGSVVPCNIHVQFYFNRLHLTSTVLNAIQTNGEAYGRNHAIGLKDPKDPSKGRQRIIIEFSSPNIAKPFHAGHLRGTIIGGFASKIYTDLGWDVIRMNYLGDWGKQYGLLAVGFSKYGSEKELEADPINHLFQVYVKINQDMDAEKKQLAQEGKNGEEESQYNLEALKYFKRMEDGDEDALKLWNHFRDLSIHKYKEVYARLNIEFDVYSGESQVKKESLQEVGRKLKEGGISEESDGAMIVNFERHNAKKLAKTVIFRKDGTPLYLTRDVAAICERRDSYNFDKIIYVVASQQDHHLQQLFKITELMEGKELSSKCSHLNFGLVSGMSTRKGEVKFLDDILDESRDTMLSVMQKNEAKYAQIEDPKKTADTLGIAAVMVQDMRGKRINGYEFNMDRMVSFEGDTGPYLQYAHTRVCSVARKVQIDPAELRNADLSLLEEEKALAIVRLLAQYPDVVLASYRVLEPSTIVTYLFRLTHAISASYDILRVHDSEPSLRLARMALYEAARQVLHNGMRLLGLTPVDR